MEQKQTTPNWAEVEKWLERHNYRDEFLCIIPTSFVVLESEGDFFYHRFFVDVDGVMVDEYEVVFLGSCQGTQMLFTPDQIKEGETELYNAVIQAMNINK